MTGTEARSRPGQRTAGRTGWDPQAVGRGSACQRLVNRSRLTFADVLLFVGDVRVMHEGAVTV